jgi:uncharacterized delta-60 repeat protein
MFRHDAMHTSRKNTPGTTDLTFGNGQQGVTGGIVYVVKRQPEGKMLIGGSFTTVNGQSRNHIARLNYDGSLDTSFLGSVPGTVYDLLVLSNGKILIGGSQTLVSNPYTYNGVARLTASGAWDTTFSNPNVSGGDVSVLDLQSDGRVIIGGSFRAVSGPAYQSVARLNANGTVDTGFNRLTPSGAVAAVAVMRTAPYLDKIVIGGAFDSIVDRGTTYPRKKVALLSNVGYVDTSFIPPATLNGTIWSVGVQQDNGVDKLVIGGEFTQPKTRLARLTMSGALDTFNIGSGANGCVYALQIQADGKIVIGGTFTQFNALTIYRIARLNTDGSWDAVLQHEPRQPGWCELHRRVNCP